MNCAGTFGLGGLASGMLCVLLCTTTAPSAQAAATERTSTTIIEEVVVVARKREESLQDVPLAVSAFNSEDLIRQGVDDLTTIDQQVPSLSISRAQGSPTGIDISLRGITAADDLITTDRAVGLYNDGVVVPHPFAFASNLYDLERVEVLKGPQGTLFGKNTVGGAINVITRKPDYDGIHGYLSGDVGNHQNYDFSAAVNVPLIEDMAAIRLAGQSNRREGYADESGQTYCGTADGTASGADLGAPGVNCFTAGDADLGDDDEWAVRGSLIADPHERLHLELVIDHAKVSETGNPERMAHWYPFEPGGLQAGFDLGILSAADLGAILSGAPSPQALQRWALADAWMADNLVTDDVYEVITGGPDSNAGFAFAPPGSGIGVFPFGHKFADSETTGYVGSIDFQLADNVLLRSVTGYREMDVTRSDDIDGTFFVITDAPLDTGTDMFTQEFNLSGTAFDERLDWVGGVFYSRETGFDGSRSAAVPAFNPNNRNVFDFDVKNVSWAMYSQAGYAFTDRLRLTAGLRFTQENKDYITRNRQDSVVSPLATCLTGVVDGDGNPLQTMDPADCEVTRTTDADDWSWLVSVDYDVTENAMVYLKTSRSFRGGAFSARAPTAPPVAPEFVEDIELGLKADWLDGRLRTNLAAYQANYDDRQVTVILNVAGTSSTLLQNAAETRIRGVELEVFAQPLDRLSLRATASWIESKWEKFENAIQANCFLPPGGFPDDVVASDVAGNADGQAGQFRGLCVRVLNGQKEQGERPWKYSLHGRYEFPVGDLGLLGMQVDWSWIDEQRGDKYSSLLSPVGNPDLYEDFTDSIGWLNARVDFEIPDYGLNIALYGTNLLDEEDIVPSADVSLSYAGMLVREPRFWGLEVRKTFGNE